MAPHFYGTVFARKDQNTLIEQSQYSEKQCLQEKIELLSYVCVVINKEGGRQLLLAGIYLAFFWSSLTAGLAPSLFGLLHRP